MAGQEAPPLPGDLTLAETATPADLAALEDGLDAFNIAATGLEDDRPVVLLLKDANGRLQAGLQGESWGGCCEMKLLWVAAERRGQGLGRHLLLAAEREAAQRGCAMVVLSTHSFQAPGFYEKLGYRCLARVEGHPAGHASLTMAKRLDPATADRASAAPGTSESASA